MLLLITKPLKVSNGSTKWKLTSPTRISLRNAQTNYTGAGICFRARILFLFSLQYINCLRDSFFYILSFSCRQPMRALVLIFSTLGSSLLVHFVGSCSYEEANPYTICPPLFCRQEEEKRDCPTPLQESP